jgi:hypothetical protein
VASLPPDHQVGVARSSLLCYFFLVLSSDLRLEFIPTIFFAHNGIK